jgi:hypothetical protein
MCPAYIQLWWIKRTVRGSRSSLIHHGLNLSILAIDTTKTPTAVRFQKKVASQQMMILSAAKSISRDVPGIYPSMVDQTSHQRQTKPHHSAWLESEYPGDRNNENTNGGSVSEESCITADDDPLCCKIDVS